MCGWEGPREHACAAERVHCGRCSTRPTNWSCEQRVVDVFGLDAKIRAAVEVAEKARAQKVRIRRKLQASFVLLYQIHTYIHVYIYAAYLPSLLIPSKPIAG